jgi:septal ring factor EnvC (AmiA/AmiB activator)
MAAETLTYAEYDWKEILSSDIEKQQREEESILEAEQRIAELLAEKESVSTRLAEAENALKQEKDAKNEIAGQKQKLELEIKKLTQEINAERSKAAVASREAPFPVGTASNSPLSGGYMSYLLPQEAEREKEEKNPFYRAIKKLR